MSLGLALAGGGIKGIAHVGALKALEEEKIKIDYIAGTSSGSIVATLFAAGYSSDEIYKIFKKNYKKIKYVEIKNVFKLFIGLIFTRKIIIKGLNSGTIIYKLINKYCKEKNIRNINEIKKQLIIPSVNMNNGEVVCFTSNNFKRNFSDRTIYENDVNIGTAVQASCSFPCVFAPCNYKNIKLIDGGTRENVPWRELKEIGADEVISVVFEDIVDERCCENLIEVAFRSFALMCKELSKYELEGIDYLIKIKSEKVSLLDFSKMDKLYKLGYNEMKRNIKKLKID